MVNNTNLFWLASYPKSGNTWFRAFLTALFNVQKNKDLNINRLATDGIFSSKAIIENALDLSADDLTQQQIIAFQKTAWNFFAAQHHTDLYVKIHDAFTFDEHHTALIPEDKVKGAIYLIRSPLDVTLSLANHTGCSLQETIDRYIINPEGYFVKKKPSPNNQFYQPLGTWSSHVESWLTGPGFPVHFVRYEDMKHQPTETFGKAADFLGLPVNEQDLQIAIINSSFEKLQQLEKVDGFKEKSVKAPLFFNKGEVGRWKKELTATQIETIKKHNEPMMKKFGYWEEQ